MSALFSSRLSRRCRLAVRAATLALALVLVAPQSAQAAEPPESSSVWPQMLLGFGLVMGAGAAGTLIGGAAGAGAAFGVCPVVNCPSVQVAQLGGMSIPDPALLFGGAALGGTLGAGALLWMAGLGITVVAE